MCAIFLYTKNIFPEGKRDKTSLFTMILNSWESEFFIRIPKLYTPTNAVITGNEKWGGSNGGRLLSYPKMKYVRTKIFI